MAHLAPNTVELPPPVSMEAGSGVAVSNGDVVNASPIGLTIVTIPATNRIRAMTLDEAVAKVVREAVDRPDVESQNVFAETFNEETDEQAPALNVAVMEAHEARIAILRTRIEALRAHGVAAALIADLNVRLRRAEAARRLAAVRVQGSSSGDDHCLMAADSHSCATNTPILASVVTGGRTPISARRYTAPWHLQAKGATTLAMGWHPRSARRRRAVRFVRLNQSMGFARRFVIVSTRTAHGSTTAVSSAFMKADTPRTTIAVTFGSPVMRGVADVPTRTRLAFARRSLAAARRSLESKDIAPPANGKVLATANLWQWDGSDRWTLTPGRS